jgi:hypothetical protein
MKEESVAYWRGKVDVKLETLSKQVGEMQSDMADMKKAVVALDKKLGNGTTFIEWRFIREKMGVPLVLAFITFLLFTILPAAFVLIYFLPKIAELTN